TGRRERDRVRRARAHRHAARGGVLPPRRHPALRPAQPARAMSPAPRSKPRQQAPAKARASRAPAQQEPPAVLLELLQARGASGREQAPAKVWLEAASAFAQVSTDLV